mmetsp:Transcript_15596/g.13323  ORF Transcript_15596/g.13323 Transcript_15596/m.13323 type:complete len:113 (+) Transcript_15596:613-951(+)
MSEDLMGLNKAPGFDSVSQRDPYEETSSNKKFDPFGIGSVDPSNFDNSDVKSERLGGTGGFNPFGINTNNNNEARTELSPHESRSEKESENTSEAPGSKKKTFGKFKKNKPS